MGGTLRMAVIGTPAHFDTATHAGTAGYVIRRAYNFLVRVGHDLNPYPDLASSWDTPDNGQTWVFQLHQGVTFHHGTPFTADDAIYTLERVLDPAVGSAGAAILAGVIGMEKNGDYELTVRLAARDADFPLKLGTYQFPIIAHDFDPARMANEVSGTGPYRMTEFIPGERVVMERFADYWEEGLPLIDTVEILTLPEEATRVNALLSGQVDLLPQLPTEFVGQIEGADGVEVGYSLAGSMQVVYMRSDRPPFDDPRVRRAVKLTLDREALLQSVRQGVGELSNDNPLAMGNPWYADTGMKARDIEEATRLLTEAGYPDGLEKDLYVPGGQPGLLELAVAVQEMARPAGFQFNLVVIPSDVFWNDNWLQEDLGVDGWALRGTADEQFRIGYYCGAAWNESHYCNEEMDALLDQAAATVDVEERKALYARVQEIFVEDGGSAIPYHFPNIAAYTSDLKDNDVHPMGFWDDSRLCWLDR
jgi:peptide/nickel transport system substrate-binding protein